MPKDTAVATEDEQNVADILTKRDNNGGCWIDIMGVLYSHESLVMGFRRLEG